MNIMKLTLETEILKNKHRHSHIPEKWLCICPSWALVPPCFAEYCSVGLPAGLESCSGDIPRNITLLFNTDTYLGAIVYNSRSRGACIPEPLFQVYSQVRLKQKDSKEYKNRANSRFTQLEHRLCFWGVWETFWNKSDCQILALPTLFTQPISRGDLFCIKLGKLH